MTKKGKVVGNTDLYHNLHPSIAAEIQVFRFTKKRRIKIEINIQKIMFF